MSYTISHFYRFGDFALDADQRVLLRGDKPVALTPINRRGGTQLHSRHLTGRSLHRFCV